MNDVCYHIKTQYRRVPCSKLSPFGRKISRKETRRGGKYYPSDFGELLAEAKTTNNSISPDEFYAANEKEANRIILKQIEYGTQSLTLGERGWIDTLAQECPFVAGYAVYKARVLQSQLNPLWFYNDLQRCNTLGMYKNSKGLFDDEESTLSGQSEIGRATISDIFRIYPNPSNEMITMEYHLEEGSSGEFEILDATGRIVLRSNVGNKSGSMKIDISHLDCAAYMYRLIRNGVICYTGKLIKN